MTHLTPKKYSISRGAFSGRKDEMRADVHADEQLTQSPSSH